jgi:peptide/nickel transport system permease protein
MGPGSAAPVAPPSPRARLAAFWDADLTWSFRHSPVAVGSFLVLVVCLAAAVFAPFLAPHNPFDLSTLNLADSFSPPRWLPGGRATYVFGTDDQGRDLLSAIM